MTPLKSKKINKVLEDMETQALRQPDPPRWYYPKKVKGAFILSAQPNQPIEDDTRTARPTDQ